MTVSIHEHEAVVAERDALRREVAALRAEIDRLTTTQPEKREDLHCVISDLCTQVRDMEAHYKAALEAEQVRFRQLSASQASEQQANECRIALVHQIHELADHIERSEYCINDTDVLKQILGQRAHAMSVASQWNQNGNPFSADTTALKSMIAKAGEVMRERAIAEILPIV